MEQNVFDVMRQNMRPMTLRELLEAVKAAAPEQDSTDVKFAILSLVRQGKAKFDKHWKVQVS